MKIEREKKYSKKMLKKEEEKEKKKEQTIDIVQNNQGEHFQVNNTRDERFTYQIWFMMSKEAEGTRACPLLAHKQQRHLSAHKQQSRRCLKLNKSLFEESCVLSPRNSACVVVQASPQIFIMNLVRK